MFIDRSKLQFLTGSSKQHLYVKLFQKLTRGFREKEFSRNLFMSMFTQVAPFTRTTCLGDQTFGNNFEKGHPRNISDNLFQNLSSLREEELLRISSCPYSASGPHSTGPCFLTDGNFKIKFLKRSFKEHLSEIILKSDQGFQRKRTVNNFSISVYSK